MSNNATRKIHDSPIWFDDLEVGDQFKTNGRTVTEADVVNFAGISADYNALHTDAQFAADTPFGQRVAHGMLIMSITSGLAARLPVIVRMTPAVMGLLDLHCKWPKPTFMGDTIHVLLTVTDKKLTSKGNSGVVTMQRDAINQRGETVMESVAKFLVKRGD